MLRCPATNLLQSRLLITFRHVLANKSPGLPPLEQKVRQVEAHTPHLNKKLLQGAAAACLATPISHFFPDTFPDKGGVALPFRSTVSLRSELIFPNTNTRWQ
jgi:hypothetical protein